MKRCYAYVRVSTNKQKKEGVSLEAQEEVIKAYATSNDLTITKWFVETKTAAKRGRGQFREMIGLLRRGSADGLIIHKVDRSARNLRDWADLADLMDNGVELHIALDSMEVSSRGERLYADVQAVVAADYIRNLREETRKGFYGRLKQGLYPLPAPVGYLNQGGGQVKLIDPMKGALVQESFERYSSGDYSLKTLLAEMTDRGLRNTKDGKISLNGISRLLNNPFYYGVIRLKSTGEHFEGKHEPLITKWQYERVQEILTGRCPKRGTTHNYTYRRLFSCGLCGRKLIGETQKGHIYYRCHTKHCQTKCLREEVMHESLSNSLSSLRFTGDELHLAETLLDDLIAKSFQVSQSVNESYGRDMRNVDDRISRLTDLLIDGLIDRDVFEIKKNALLERKLSVRDKLKANDENAGWIAEKVRETLELAKRASTSYEIADCIDKRRLVIQTTSNRIVTGKNVSTELQFPFAAIANRHLVSIGDPCRGVPRTFVGLDSTQNTESLIQGMVEKLWIWAKVLYFAENGRI